MSVGSLTPILLVPRYTKVICGGLPVSLNLPKQCGLNRRSPKSVTALSCKRWVGSEQAVIPDQGKGIVSASSAALELRCTGLDFSLSLLAASISEGRLKGLLQKRWESVQAGDAGEGSVAEETVQGRAAWVT